MTLTERQSLVLVGFAHLALFAILSLGLRSIKPPLPPEDPTPVDVVDLANVPKIAKPPKPLKLAAPEKTVEATAPDPTPPAPKPEPAPAPDPTPIPKPEKPKLKDEPVEKPEPPKPEKVKPDKPKPEKAKPAPKLLDAEALSTLLDKSMPKAKVKPLDTSALAKSIEKSLPKTTRVDPRAAATLIAAIRSQVAPCWNPPIGGADAKKVTVLLHLDINRDGSIVGRPGIVSQTGVTSGNADYARAFAETARRSVLRCSPLRLPSEQYDQWKAVEINFDPSDL